MRDIITRIDHVIKNFSFTDYGFTRLKKPLSIDIYKQWLKKSFHGDMAYLENHLPAKEDPKKLVPQAQSAIVVIKKYVPHPYPASKSPLKALKIAKYARGFDYHREFKKELDLLGTELRSEFTGL